MTKRTKEEGLRVQLALSQLYERHQKLTPSLVVEAATDPKSPLHREFTWDDSEAARKYRLAQARTLIRSVEVKVTVGQMIVAAPAYVRSPKAAPSEQGYLSTTRLQGDSEASRQALRYETQRAHAMMERARSVALVLGLESEFAQLMEAFEKVQARLVA